jgi:rhamnulose-1-phosphate aldolase
MKKDWIGKYMNEFLKADFINEIGRTADQMYQNGWHERNSGNISYLLTGSELDLVKDLKGIRVIELQCEVKDLEGKCFVVTGSGKYIKNISRDPLLNLGVIRVLKGGKQVEILGGFKDGGRPTSELSTHLLTHQERLRQDQAHKVVIHTHATNIMAMTFVHELNDRSFTRSLWQMCTESIVVFPDGVGVLPWMLCGNERIGYKTAEKMKNHRLVVWAMHGVFASGSSLDDCFGLIETVEKSAQIYLMTLGKQMVNTIEDYQLKELAETFEVNYKKEYLDV